MSAQDPRYIIYSSQIQIHAQRSNPVYIKRAYFSERGPQFVHKLQSQCTTFTFFSSSLFSSLKKDGCPLFLSLLSRSTNVTVVFALLCRNDGKKEHHTTQQRTKNRQKIRQSIETVCTFPFFRSSALRIVYVQQPLTLFFVVNDVRLK